ncbi:TetR/AcrR family transcriptional regulator [Saccharopolyspora indica]|uniref:TetR/AcrR family transcriptional regulator n=1 Tax=Saccharopolyspora indica TaxID=1229659 RepID=UPI0022EAAEAF|nr:TetR/AcrR family transcriptional regulator [Saccharopolyspora indica]MDA3648650.1 TetR/AcrR family transcriptional regulator [Saccharopolyspora indica]
MRSQEAGGRAVRRDAERNRALIIGAARTALEADGNASMHAIAKAAGVGQGTLYRHFPTREALVMTVHRNDVQDLVDAAPALLAKHPPAVALRRWFDRLAQYGRIKHGLANALHTAMHAELAEEGYGPVVTAIGSLLEAGVRDGTLREDITPEEVLLLVGFLWRIAPDATWQDRTRRLLDITMDALRAESPNP